MYLVYILRCSDNSYYTGVTRDVDKRVWEHNQGFIPNAYTHTRRPLKLVFSEGFENVYDAISAEKQIKGWRRAKKEALISRQFELLSELSKRYKPNPSYRRGSRASPRQSLSS